MKKITLAVFSATMALCLIGCGEKKTETSQELTDSVTVSVPDSALYGTVNEATTMHTLVIVTDEGKTLEYAMNVDEPTDIQGGVFVGDRMTITTSKAAEAPYVVKALNLTTLLGKWTSLDRNFEIKENGVVESNISAESNPYTSWSTANANLILNKDTFTVNLLDADSLTLENDKGIYVYKRQALATKK